MDWRTRIDHELMQAEMARQRGKEGMARVCARRAAGIAIGVYLERMGLPDPGPSAYDRLRYLQSRGGMRNDAERAIDHLVWRVDQEFKLPEEVDLISDARGLIKELLGE